MPKRDLVFSKPMMNAAGMLGFAPNFKDSLPWEDFGAFVTNPISLLPRIPSSSPEYIKYPGGLLLHTGLPSPGFKSVIKKYASLWTRSRLPVIVHLMADRPEETIQMVRGLEGLENILAIELGFAPNLSDDILILGLEMYLGELPLIVNLPAEQVSRLGPRLIDAGASALSVGAPRGMLSGRHGSLISGRLYGPSLFPQSLELIRSAARIGLPVIASNGLYSRSDCDQMLEAGAIALQLDTVLWSNTALLPEE